MTKDQHLNQPSSEKHLLKRDALNTDTDKLAKMQRIREFGMLSPEGCVL